MLCLCWLLLPISQPVGLCPNLTGVMRVSTRGNIADRCYYDGSSTHEYQEPYLSVNRRTNMASLLSEAGFHTIAEQQSRNLNDDYKKLEAVAAMQSILKYRGMELPDVDRRLHPEGISVEMSIFHNLYIIYKGRCGQELAHRTIPRRRCQWN